MAEDETGMGLEYIRDELKQLLENSSCNPPDSLALAMSLEAKLNLKSAEAGTEAGRAGRFSDGSL